MAELDLRSYDWALSYRTSSVWPDGRPVDVMHDFYLPALQRATRYDRMAGYFRSSSLAAASQGFSAFVGHGGKMRLIVGADLALADVRAILAGNQARLSELLLAELVNPELWETAEQDGVRLLGALVAAGVLDVKVAIRVHGQTGEPLTWEDCSDGYVHEKWFVMGDDADDFLYGSGSLNESRTALLVNAENIDLHCSWMGRSDAMRVEQAIADFEALWDNQRPHIRVLSLPEAVRLRLIRLAERVQTLREIDGTLLHPARVAMSAKERLAWGLLADGPLLPNGRWVGLATAPITPWPHQMVVVRRLVSSWPYSYLLCDEVGLGKTIEAGLVFRCLYLSGLCQRILVAAPASLAKQWHKEMAEKVLLPFALLGTGPIQKHSFLLPDEHEVKSEDTFEPDLLIVSTGILERQERQGQFLSARPFDLALVDEAHNARRSNSVKGTAVKPDYGKLYRFLYQCLRAHASCLYLATATPMQLHAVEVYDLLALTRRGGAYLEDPTLLQSYYQLLQRLRAEESLQPDEWEWLLQNLRQLERLDPPFWLYLQQSLLRETRTRRALDSWLNYADQTPVPGKQSESELGRLLTQTAPLARVMLRHSRSLLKEYRRRGELDQQLAERQSKLHLVPFSDRELVVYQRLEDYCRGLQQQLQGGDNQRKNTLMFYLSFLRQRFASSLYAINRTLERRLARVQETLELQMRQRGRAQNYDEQSLDWDEDEDDAATMVFLKDRSIDDLRWEQAAVQALLRDLRSLRGTPSKVTELLQLLDGRRLLGQPDRLDQIVIFTRYFDTLRHLREELQRSDSRLRLGVYSGGELSYYGAEQRDWRTSTREEVKQRFLRKEIDVLLCTDAAAEGLNLQSADTLVNFDLGWNPMKLEQRIGRIDRIGQKHPLVFIHNFCYRDSVEQAVYDRLGARLRQAELIVGEQQPSMLPVTLEDFAQLASGELDEDRLLEEAKQRLAAQRASAAAQELSPAEIYEMYTEWNKAWDRQPVPVGLVDIERLLTSSSWLAAQGAEVRQVVDGSGEHQVLYWPHMDSTGCRIACLFTWDRDLYERGLSQSDHPIAFGSYGNPVFDRLLAASKQEELPPCIRRLTVPVPGLPGREQVGYAVAAQHDSGLKVRLVTNLADIAQLELAEEAELTEQDTAACLGQLRDEVQQEWQTMQAVPAIEERNLIAGRAQSLFNLEVGAAMLDVIDDETFGRAMKSLREHFGTKSSLPLHCLPTARLRPLVGDLLSPPELPTVGDYMDYRVSDLVAQPALDAVSRHLHIDEDRRSLRREQAVNKLRVYLSSQAKRGR